MRTLVRSLTLVVLCCSLSLAPGQAQQTESQVDEVRIVTTQNDPTLSDREKKELKRKLSVAAENNVKALEADNAPLAIGQAKVRGVKMDGNYDTSARASAPINDYVMQLSVKLVNRDSRSITGFGVEFANPQSNSVFYVYDHPVEIGVTKSYGLEIGFIAVSGDPAELTMRLVGVRFADGTVWGSFPLAPRNTPPRLSQTPSTSKAAPVGPFELVTVPVDSRPKLLNQPMPRYTVDARQNRVLGVAILRILVDTDGSVKRANVIRPLPDGLTEEALRAAYALKFDPAKRNNQPVPYWQALHIEFNLK